MPKYCWHCLHCCHSPSSSEPSVSCGTSVASVGMSPEFSCTSSLRAFEGQFVTVSSLSVSVADASSELDGGSSLTKMISGSSSPQKLQVVECGYCLSVKIRPFTATKDVVRAPSGGLLGGSLYSSSAAHWNLGGRSCHNAKQTTLQGAKRARTFTAFTFGMFEQRCHIGRVKEAA